MNRHVGTALHEAQKLYGANKIPRVVGFLGNPHLVIASRHQQGGWQEYSAGWRWRLLPQRSPGPAPAGSAAVAAVSCSAEHSARSMSSFHARLPRQPPVSDAAHSIKRRGNWSHGMKAQRRAVLPLGTTSMTMTRTAGQSSAPEPCPWH